MSDLVSSTAARDANIRIWAAQLLENPAIKNPQEVFDEQHIAVQVMVDREIGLLNGSDPTSDLAASRERLIQYLGRLNQLEHEHKATAQDKEQIYNRQMRERHKQQFVDHVGHLGLSLAGEWIKELVEAAAAAAAGNDTSVVDRSDSLPDGSVAQSGVRDEAAPDALGNAHPAAGRNDELGNMDEPNRDEPRPDQLQSDQPQLDTQLPSDLEPQAETQPVSNHPPRTETQPSPPKRPSIDFEQVFQGGHAEIKYQIARFPRKDGAWYILECKQHGQHFTKEPLIGGARHLRAAHGNLHGTHDEAVQILGTRVRNCNPELAKMNNDAAQEAFRIGLGMPTLKRHPRKPRPTNEPRSTTRSSRSAPIIINPQPGEIYAAYWKLEKRFYPVLTLPHEGLQSLLRDRRLLKAKPSCCVVDEEKCSRDWAPGFEDGGPHVEKRKYPVIYFDKPTFPDKCHIGWVRVKDLKEFDPNDKEIPHRDLVAEYMQGRATGNPLVGASLTNNPEGGEARQELQPIVDQEPSVKQEGGEPILEQWDRRFPQSPICLSSDDESDLDDETHSHPDDLDEQAHQDTQMELDGQITQDKGNYHSNEAEGNGTSRIQPQEQERNDVEELDGIPDRTDVAGDDEMLFDYKVLWRLSSSDVVREMQELQPDLVGAIRQGGGGRVNTPTPENWAPVTTETGGASLFASGNSSLDALIQHSGHNLAAPGDDTDTRPALEPKPPQPGIQQCLSKTQPSPSSALLIAEMAEKRYRQIVGARTTVSTATKGSRDKRPTSRPTGASGYLAASPSAQQAGSQPQPERYSSLDGTASTNNTPNQVRRDSFLDAVLGPRAESRQLNGSPQLAARQVPQDDSNTQPRVQSSTQMYSWFSTQAQGPAQAAG